MKKIYTTLLSSLSLFGFSQTQITNAGFENWGNAAPGVSAEPTNWYSNKSGSSTAQLGPQTCSQDNTNPHSGTSSAKIETKTVPFIGTVVNGNVTTGVINAPSTNKADGYIGTVNYSSSSDIRRMTFTGRPDSLVGYIRYTSGGTGETGKVTAILHNGNYFDPETPTTYHADPTVDKVARATYFTPTGNTASWTRFSVPFVYTSALTPAYIMVNITSSANQLTSIAGSILWVDDLLAIYNPPVANFNFASVICPNAVTTFSDQSTKTPTSWLWSFPGGTPSTSTSQNPSITYAASGTYSVTLTSANANGTSTAVTKTISVGAAPVITVNTPTICTGQSVILTAGGATSYVWNTGATSNSITVSPSANTNYTVTGTGSTGCVSTKTTVVTVSANNLNVNAATICSGGTVALVVSGASTYTWTSPASNSATITVSPTASTNYTVMGTNASGCVYTATTSVSITSAASISVNSATVCAGNTATLTATGVSTYTWTNPISNSAVVTVMPGVTTVYTVTGNAAGCSGVATATTSVLVNPTPVVSLAAITVTPCVGDGAIALSGSPTGGVYSGTGVSAGSFMPTTPGTFTVLYTYSTTAGCSSSDSKTINVNACVGIKEISLAEVKLYPNPANEVLYISLSNVASEPKLVEVYDVIGNKVVSVNTTETLITLNTSTLSNGMYIVKLQVENSKPVITRFIKK